MGAAATRFAAEGFDATTMAQIASDVGLKISSVYYYFANKAEILGRILDEVNSVPIALFDDACAAHAEPAERLHAFVQSDVEALCTFAFDINEVHRVAQAEPETFARYWADRGVLVARVEALIAEGIADRAFRTVDPHLAAMTILANDEATRHWYRPTEPELAPEEVGEFLADFALRGLLADEGAE